VIGKTEKYQTSIGRIQMTRIRSDHDALATTDIERSLTVGEVWVQSTQPIMIKTEHKSRATEFEFQVDYEFMDGGGI
jgi:hypothetical protein